MHTASNLVAETLRVSFTAVLELSREADELRLHAGRGWPADFVGKYTASVDRQTPAGYALLAQEPVFIEDSELEARLTLSPHMVEQKIRSVVLVTIGGKLQPFGVLGAYSERPGYFSTDDIHFLQSIANVLAAAIERKRAEEVIRQAQQVAERANAAKSEFLSRMSHELRTPLNAILGFSQVLELDRLEEPQAQGVGHILKAGRHLLTLIDEVLDIAQIESGRLDLDLTPVFIHRLLVDVIALVRPLADRRQIRLEHRRDEQTASCIILADAKRLRQVLLNLLSNAIKYNHEGGHVGISVVAADGRARIAVRDTGPGIAAEKLDRLYSPFDRLGAEQTSVEGSGLGLALSKRLVEAQGGAIEMISQLGEGSTVVVTLPLAVTGTATPTSADVAADLPSLRRATLPPTEPAVPRTVLYIEDNASNLDLVRNLLARQPAIELLAAMRGDLGFEMAALHQPDLILLDLHLPDISGEEVLRQLRSDPRTRSIPVVVISADAIPAQIGHLLACGARDYITKPFELDRFLEVVQNNFRAREAQLAEKMV